jgi:hypothetical protein
MGPKDDRPDGHGSDSSQKNSAGRYILGVANERVKLRRGYIRGMRKFSCLVLRRFALGVNQCFGAQNQVRRSLAGPCARICASNLSKAAGSLGYVSAIDSRGRTIWIARRRSRRRKASCCARGGKAVSFSGNRISDSRRREAKTAKLFARYVERCRNGISKR